MAVGKLCASFRQIALNRHNVIARYCSSYVSKEQNNILPVAQFSNNASSGYYPQTSIKFVPRTLNIDFGIPSNGIKNNIIETPFKHIPSMEDPSYRRPIQHDLPLTDKSLELPSPENIFEKLAVRLIVIRRQKMKKHKRKKFRKRMRADRMKQRIRRNILKEKLFQTELVEQIQAAESFDVKEYINKKFAELDKERLPLIYRTELLPPRIIKQFMEEKKLKQEARRNKFRLKLD